MENLVSPRNPREVWEQFNLQMNSNNTSPRNNLHNGILFLKNHSLTKDKIWFDEFSHKIKNVFGKDVPAEWSDIDTLMLTELIQVCAMMPNINTSTVFDSVIAYAHLNKKNEVKDWLTPLIWDGTCRIENSLSDYFGAVDSVYTRTVSRNFWISMVARVMRPGCKVDNMIILEGKQGQFKSTALAVIGGQWYSEINEQIGSKDFYLCIQGKLLLEISELDSFKKAESTTIKKVITCTTDRFRPPYGKNSVDYQRQCVFVGTTNDDSYLRDSTGGRRFWPIKTGIINLEKLKTDREQLFAEALDQFKSGEPWWQVPNDLASTEQESRRQADPWEEVLSVKLRSIDDLTVTEAFAELGIGFEKQTHAEGMRIAKILFLLGYEKYQRTDKARTRAWRKIER